MKSICIRRYVLPVLTLAIALPLTAQSNSDEKQIQTLIATYATTSDRADTAMAERVFSDAPEVSFINPRGEDRGPQQIVTNFITNLMGVETQIYRRENGQWRIVHVHYSGAPVTGNLKGF